MKLKRKELEKSCLKIPLFIFFNHENLSDKFGCPTSVTSKK